MITKFKNKTISSVLTVFPQQEIDFMDEMNNYGYSELKMNKLKKLNKKKKLIIPQKTKKHNLLKKLKIQQTII